MKFDTLRTRVKQAQSLSELVKILNEISTKIAPMGLKLDEIIDLSSLPTYGGNNPRDTFEIFSWDEGNILSYGPAGWAIEPRCRECGEALFHCFHREN